MYYQYTYSILKLRHSGKIETRVADERTAGDGEVANRPTQSDYDTYIQHTLIP